MRAYRPSSCLPPYSALKEDACCAPQAALQCPHAAPAAQVGRLAGLFPLYLFTPWVEDSLQASGVVGQLLVLVSLAVHSA